MNVSNLPRCEVRPTLQRMLELRPAPERERLQQRLTQDQALLDRTPGDTFGGMWAGLDQESSSLETRSVGLRFGGAGLLYFGLLGAFGAWLVHPALGVAIGAAGLTASGLCLTSSYRSGMAAEAKRAEADRVYAWLVRLEGCSDEVEAYLDRREEIGKLRDGLVHPESGAIHEHEDRIDIGPVPVKRREGWSLDLQGWS